MDPITLAIVSGVATIVYDRYKDKNSSKSLPLPVKFTQDQIRSFTTARNGIREFDADIVNAPIVQSIINALRVTEVKGPPGCTTLRAVPPTQGDYVSRTIAEVIDAATKDGKMVLISFSIIVVEPTLYMPGPVALIIGEPNVRALAGQNGDFAVWNSKTNPIEVQTVMDEKPEAVDHVEAKAESKPAASPVAAPSNPVNGRPTAS